MNTVFLQSETDNPFRTYARMRKEHPVYRDKENRVWTIYNYRDCKFFLKNELAEIPRTHPGPEKRWNEYTRMIRENLVRRSNPPKHGLLKEAVTDLVRLMRPVDIPEVLDSILKEADIERLHWSETVAGVLPVTVLLKSMQFRDDDIGFILSHMPVVKLYMAGNPDDKGIQRLNTFSQKVYPLVENHFQRIFSGMSSGGAYVSNLIGLCIQSYDAMRGLLGNSLLHYLDRKDGFREGKDNDFRKLVAETLRFDPVFHNTRRILKEDVERGGYRLKKGEELLLVLASANRDASVFDNAETFDMYRENNDEYLSFSSGIHYCPADHFSINLAADILKYMNSKYRDMELLQPKTIYAPMTNARIPENIILKLFV